MSAAQQKKRKQFSKTLKSQIKRKPHTEPINGKDYTYGLLQKKSESSLFSNERFLLINGIQSFGYASQLPDSVILPFQQEKNIPKFKVQIPLQKIEINNDKQILVIEFQQDNKKQKTKWQFKCGSKAKAIEWRQKLQGAKNEKISAKNNSAVKVILEDPAENQQSQVKPLKQSDKKQKRENQQMKIEDDNNQHLQDKPLAEMITKNQKQIEEERLQQEEKKKQANNRTQEENNKDVQSMPNIFDNLLGISSNPKDQKGDQSEKKSQKNYQNQDKEQYDATKNLSNILLGGKSKRPHRKDTEEQDNEVSSGVNAREEFRRKKRQQNQAQQQIQGGGFLDILNTVTDTKFQIQKLKKEWGFQFAKGQNEHQIIEQFRIYIQTITVKIIDQLCLQNRKRYYKPIEQTSQSIRYQIEGVSIQFFLNQLSDITSNFEEKTGSVIGNERIKQAYQQLKNYDYILQLTNNKGRIRVPLAMCVEYKGFVGLAKVIIPQAENYDNLESLQKQLDLLQAESRIHNSVFQDSQNGRIVPLQNKLYEKLSRAQNNPRKFDTCYIEGLKYYLPQDFYRFNKNQSLTMLRKQLIQQQEYQDTLLYGQNMSNVVNRLKIPQYLKEGVEVLTQISKTISERVNALVQALENLDEVITNSKDLSNLIHGYGINIRYLGLILERANETWLKAIIMSEIAARCAKYFLKFDLQDCILNLNESKPQNIRKFQIKQTVSFLNKMLGNSEQTENFWIQLSRQAQTYYQCYIDRSNINTGFLIQSLQKQCRIKLTKLNSEDIEYFRSPSPFSSENFASFELKSKTYDLGFTDLYHTVNNHLKDLSQQSYEQLSILLNLNRKGNIAGHFNLNNFSEKIILFMINWLSPEDGHSLYYPDQIKFGQVLPYKSLYQIKLTEIKWLLKDGKEAQSQKVRDWIVEHINRWIGDYHPILSQLYDLYSRYYLSDKHMEKKAVNYCKSGIKNQEKLLGNNHIKLADNYYMLATIYINYDRKIEALNSLKRSKQILENGDSDQSQAYGVITLKMGQLLLASNSLKDSLDCAVEAYSKLVDGDSLESYVQCIQLISRCYEVAEDWDEYRRFSDEISAKLPEVAEDSLLLERAVKIVVMPYFHQLSTNAQITKRVLNILQAFPRTTYSNNMAFGYLKEKIQSNAFPAQFIDQLEFIQELLTEIESTGIMTRWKGFENVMMNKSLLNKIGTSVNVKGFQLLATLEALNIFLGEGFIQGVFWQQ